MRYDLTFLKRRCTFFEKYIKILIDRRPLPVNISDIKLNRYKNKGLPQTLCYAKPLSVKYANCLATTNYQYNKIEHNLLK